MKVPARIRLYLQTLSTHLRYREAAMLLADAIKEIDRLRLTDAEREAIKRQVDWMARTGIEAGDIHCADLLLQDAVTLRGLLERTK